MSEEFKRMQQLAGIINENNEPESEMGTVRTTYNTLLTPKNASVEDVDKALNDIENYGKYKTQVIRNGSMNKAEIAKAIENHFGPSIPAKKKAALKLRGGEPFPPRTKQSLDDFISQFSGKPRLLHWEKEGEGLIFKQGKNPQLKLMQDVIAQVMDSAGIEYSLSKKEEI